MYPLWKVAVGEPWPFDSWQFIFQSYSVALNGPKKSTLPYCSQLMSSIAGAAGAGACSCYSCVWSGIISESFWWFWCNIGSVVSIICRCIFYLFVSIINLTFGMILLFYQYHIHGTTDAVQLQSQSKPYIIGVNPCCRDSRYTTLVNFWYCLQSKMHYIQYHP